MHDGGCRWLEMSRNVFLREIHGRTRRLMTGEVPNFDHCTNRLDKKSKKSLFFGAVTERRRLSKPTCEYKKMAQNYENL